jgi:serine/threonine protein kinase
VKDTPASVTDVNPALPREFARIVRRALTKDLERRYQTAKDLRNDLEELKASLDSDELTSQSPTVASTKGVSKWVWLAGAVVVAIAIVAIVLNLSNKTPAPPAPPTVQLVALTSTGNVRTAGLP